MLPEGLFAVKTLVALTALLLAGCSPGGAQDKKEGGAPPAVAVSAIQVAPRAVPVTFEAVGRTEGSREVQVRARVAGIVERQLYNEGDAVKAGAPLFRIERAPYEIELAQARAALAQERARQELAQQEMERLKGLADRRAISQKEADQAASGARQSTAAVQMAQARLRQAELPPCSRSARWCSRTTTRHCSPPSRAATRSGCASRFRKPSTRA
jgi:membrane fusion protein, multidrug efflux system